jgi:hypothetical protein
MTMSDECGPIGGQIGYARSYEAPTIGAGPSVGAVRDSAHQPYFPATQAKTVLGISFFHLI